MTEWQATTKLLVRFKEKKMSKALISRTCFIASIVSVAASIVTWALAGDDPAHAERFGIFIGLWAPTLMGLANYYKPRG